MHTIYKQQNYYKYILLNNKFKMDFSVSIIAFGMRHEQCSLIIFFELGFIICHNMAKVPQVQMKWQLN